jgi:hypothetical protein
LVAGSIPVSRSKIEARIETVAVPEVSRRGQVV